MYSRKRVRPSIKSWGTAWTGSPVNISHPEPHKAVCYVEMKKKTENLAATNKKSAIEQNDHRANQKAGHIYEGLQALEYFTNNIRKANMIVDFTHCIQHILHRDLRWDIPTFWKTKFRQTSWKDQIICTKVQAHSSSKPLLGYNQEKMW